MKTRPSPTLDDFRSFIKVEVGGYEPRRKYLREQLQPAFDLLERGEAPGDETVAATLKQVDARSVHAAWQKALERWLGDPDGAITASRALLEAVCKHILNQYQVAYDDSTELPRLYHLATMQLQLAPSQQTEDLLKRMLGACHTVVDSIAALRNRLGDAHGKGSDSVAPDPRHAELAVNLAGAVATFLVATSMTAEKAQQ